MNILLVEDEENISRFIQQGLSEAGNNVTPVFNGESATKSIKKSKFDVIVLDIMLPDMSGYDILKIVRSQDKFTPVLMLSALSTSNNIVKGLSDGADDYLVKPFKFEELLARIIALHRRTGLQNKAEQAEIEFKDLKINFESKQVWRNNQIIKLTAREFKLLQLFMENPNKVFSKEELLDRVWGLNFDPNTNIVEVYINYLRNKIDKGFEPKLIHTVIGMGYALRVNA
jgi:DNA-binding response OmpR family regulator